MPEDEAILMYLRDMGYVPAWFADESVWTRLQERGLVKPCPVELVSAAGDGHRFFDLYQMAAYVAAEDIHVKPVNATTPNTPA